MMKRIMTFVLAALFSAGVATAAEECKNRGTLDEMYCDENMDLVADTPKDENDWKDPRTLVFTYTPVEDPAVFAALVEHHIFFVARGRAGNGNADLFFLVEVFIFVRVLDPHMDIVVIGDVFERIAGIFVKKTA